MSESNYLNFKYLKQRKLFERLDILPFIILHSFLLIFYLNDNIHPFFKTVVFILFALIQAIVFFSKFWSQKLKSLICYKETNDISNASHVRIDLENNQFKMNNRTDISEIKVVNNDIDSKLIVIEFDKLNYIFNRDINSFELAKYDLNKPVKEFLNAKGYNNKSSTNIELTRTKLGLNIMRIPIPSFFELYKEHIVAPFFVFQLFCIMLWIFDDYGISSAMTLSMLCVFEATVVGQRIMNLVTLRKMRNPPHYINVFRNNNWSKLSSVDLLPGDIVSIVPGTNLETCPEPDNKQENNAFFVNIINKMKELKKKAEEKKGIKSVNTIININKEKEPYPLTCDLLLLSGTVIINESMLTGESIPQIKDSVSKLEEKLDLIYDSKSIHKLSTLFAGTTVIKATREKEDMLPSVLLKESNNNDTNKDNNSNNYYLPPDNGCICLVTKTGFNTSQGELLRTVMFSSDKNQGESKEAFIFIFILLGIAIYASYLVYLEGIEREGELTYKLLLRCIIIVTSVVPAELPIELSLAINNSLIYLQSKKIVCIEPFRIPYAGKIDVCCFDKTGTLTKDEFIFKGIVQPSKTKDKNNNNNNNNEFSIKETNELSEETTSILLGCNSLIYLNNKTVGDPIELVVFNELKGSIKNNSNNNVITASNGLKITIEKRFPFDSSLKRMSVLALINSAEYKNHKYKRILSKGAPEVMKSMFNKDSIPKNYDEIANNYAKKGYRILTIGYREDDSIDIHSTREEIEKDHVFCGFIIVETPLKKDTYTCINELINADLDCVIITGDHSLTTAKVAIDLNIGPSNVCFTKFNVLNNEKINNNNNNDNNLSSKSINSNNTESSIINSNNISSIDFLNLDNKVFKTINVNKEFNENSFKNDLTEISKSYIIGITGDELSNLESLSEDIIKNKHLIYNYYKIFCRVSPLQKDLIISQLIKSGKNPSMCGDGSNDVGALKRAMIGVALLNIEDNNSTKDNKKGNMQQQPESPFSILTMEDEAAIKSGDVTAAAPFSSKSESIKCIKNIFIRGRCTLVITFQMFKILALNCLLTAYSMSVLALKGVKFSDYQSTFVGFLIAFLFLMLSKGEPLKKLNKNKPQFTFFTLESIISIVCQSISHLASLQIIISITEQYDSESINKSKSFDDPFEPTLVNTVVFLYVAINNVSNFLVNYIGEPFMENINKNIWMQRLCLAVWIGVVVCVYDLSPELREYFELLPLPENYDYKFKFMSVLFVDLAFSYFVENWKKIFRLYK